MSIDTFKKNSSAASVNVLAQNLRLLMKKFDLDLSELSKKTGIALTTLTGLRRGVGNPTLSTLNLLADLFNINISELTEIDLSDQDKKLNNIYDLPLVTLDDLTDFLLDNKKYRTIISTELKKWNPGKYYAVKIENNAMFPLFEKGTIFILASEVSIKDGDIVLVQFKNHIPCFRKVFIENETFFFKPISEIINNNLTSCTNFIIHGVVIKAIQHF